MKPIRRVGLVVEPGDADPGVPLAGLYPLDDDHRTICKPKSKQAEIHLKTVTFVRDCLNIEVAHRDTIPNRTRWVSKPFESPIPGTSPIREINSSPVETRSSPPSRKQLTQRRKAALAQAISGLGGIGKTQTAVEYAYRYRDKYQAVLWLNAESTLSLKTGCCELARLTAACLIPRTTWTRPSSPSSSG